MSMFTNVGNYAHGALLNGAGLSALNHISSGAGIGAGLGALNAVATGNDSILGGAMSGAAAGAIMGGGTRFASMKYASGVNSFINNTVDASGKVFAGTKQSMVQDISNFKFGHFTRPGNSGEHANYWHPDSAALRSTRFQNYNPSFTPAVNPGAPTLKAQTIDKYTQEYVV